MNGRPEFDGIVAAWLASETAPAHSERVLAAALTRVAATDQDRHVTQRLFGDGIGRSQELRWALLAAALATALVATALMAGAGRENLAIVLPPPTGPAGNGLVAYSVDGDIYVGDRATRQTTAIVTGPEADSSPKFSPDGSRIAFMRGDQWGADASIIVVRADGSDERVVMPAGFSRRGTDFTWTPDGGSLLVNHDSRPLTTPYFDGELSLFDASGGAEPRLLTPPLPIGPGGPYFRNTDQVAPMFRPPNGDAILSGAGVPTATHRPIDRLYLWDVDLERARPLGDEALNSFEPYYIAPWDLWWSPDGSSIAFHLIDRAYDEIGFFVMNADGTNVRRLMGVEGAFVWSPDGSQIAYQRGCPDQVRQGAVIVVLDVASGAERVLEASAVETKYEGDVSPVPPGEGDGCYGGWIQGQNGRAWDYEGWSWSPDGHDILMLETRGARPIVIDVDTGNATELPWEADSAPSWQRIPPTDSR
jgi:dipeptidyl aminopeptidase/acylaminoacyl peptidase